jgi:PAS domain S-box-containing protein
MRDAGRHAHDPRRVAPLDVNVLVALFDPITSTTTWPTTGLPRTAQRLGDLPDDRERVYFCPLRFAVDPGRTPGRIAGMDETAVPAARRWPPALGAGRQLGALVDAIPALVSIADRDYVYRYVNRSYSEWFGRTAPEIVGHHMSEILGPEAFAIIKPRLDATLAGETVHYEATLPYRTGGTRYVLATYTPDRDDNGEVAGIFVLVQDLTARRKAELALSESERALRESGAEFDAFFALPNVGKVQADPATGLIVRANRKLSAITGFAEDELLGRPLEDLTPGHADVVQAFTRGETDEYSLEPRFTRKDGAEIRLRVDASMLRDERGEPKKAIAAVRDITEEKRSQQVLEEAALESARAEAALREHRDVLALAMRGGRMGAWSRDIRTGRVWWSHELEEIVGLPPGAFQGSESAFFDLVHQDDRRGVEDAVAQAIRSRGDYTIEFRFEHATGEWRWMEGRGRAVYSESDEPVMLYGIAIDITDRKRAEDELRRLNVELSEDDRRKDQFIALLAHELRNPLAPVRFSLDLLRLPGASQVEHEQARVIIERQVTQMSKLLDDLLDVARVGTGKLQVSRGPVSLTATLQMAIETSRPLVERQHHDLQVSLPATELTVMGDPVRLTQVFANLLNNAARYTPPGGALALSAAAAPDGHAVVRVSDNGVGLRPDQLRTIFKPFEQAHEPGYSGGLGLGLSLAQAIVMLHDGTIDARSDGPGRGTKFVVTLPLVTAVSEEAPALMDRGRSPLDGRRVLVVDDNQDAAGAMAVLLSVDGHEIATAYDGASALASAESARPDVVLLDIGLPDITGYEVARRLRALEDGDRMTIVAISGWGQARDKQLAFDSGFDAHLTKPADPSQVRALLRDRPTPRG